MLFRSETRLASTAPSVILPRILGTVLQEPISILIAIQREVRIIGLINSKRKRERVSIGALWFLPLFTMYSRRCISPEKNT